MMIRFFSFALLVLIYSVSVRIVLAQDQNDSSVRMVEGVVVVKMKSGYSIPPRSNTTGLHSLDAKIDDLQVTSIDPLFTRFAGGRRLADTGLDRIYNFHYTGIESPNTVADRLSRDSHVEYAEPRYLSKIAATPNDTYYNQQDQFEQVSAPAAWDLVKGDSGDVVIAVVDGGTYWQHPDLAANIWMNPDEISGNGIDDDNNGFIDDIRGWNFANNTNNPAGLAGQGYNGSHGTSVAGFAGVVTNNGTGLASMSWNARIMPINAASYNHDFYLQWIDESVIYAALNGADIINISNTSGIYSSLSEDVVDFASSQGCVIVAAAGNSNTNLDIAPRYPASFRNVLGVGATGRDNDVKAGISSYGTSVGVYAPGANLSTISVNGSYGAYGGTGTSYAAPMVAGLAALVKIKFPDWSANQIMEQIRVTSDIIDDQNPSLAGLLGHGRINALRAVTETNHPSVRITGVNYVNQEGNALIMPGDTVNISISLTNYLHEVTSVEVSLSTGGNATVLSFVDTTGFLGTGDTVLLQ